MIEHFLGAECKTSVNAVLNLHLFKVLIEEGSMEQKPQTIIVQ